MPHESRSIKNESVTDKEQNEEGSPCIETKNMVAELREVSPEIFVTMNGCQTLIQLPLT